MLIKEKNKNEDGQAILEFMLFLPFMLMLYSVCMSVGSAINASINQQKIARGYFYFRAQNNSTLPKPRRNGAEPSDGWNVFGMQIMGFAKELANGETPVAPCFKFRLPLGDSEDECEGRYNGSTTQFIRVKTVYGVCGATYVKGEGNARIAYPRGAANASGGNLRHCELL